MWVINNMLIIHIFIGYNKVLIVDKCDNKHVNSKFYITINNLISITYDKKEGY